MLHFPKAAVELLIKDLSVFAAINSQEECVYLIGTFIKRAIVSGKQLPVDDELLMAKVCSGSFCHQQFIIYWELLPRYNSPLDGGASPIPVHFNIFKSTLKGPPQTCSLSSRAD